MSGLVYERMHDSLEQLSLHRALECVDALLDRVANGQLSSVDLLDQLLDAELTVRRFVANSVCALDGPAV
jgi:hypothetical protein